MRDLSGGGLLSSCSGLDEACLLLVIHGHFLAVSVRILNKSYFLRPKGEGRKWRMWHGNELLVKTLEKWPKRKSSVTQTLHRRCGVRFRTGQTATRLADGTRMQGFQEGQNPPCWSWQPWQLVSSAWTQSSLVGHLTQPPTSQEHTLQCLRLLCIPSHLRTLQTSHLL